MSKWKKNRAVETYWLENYIDTVTKLCALCGNSGLIDTRDRAISHAGVHAGKVNFCICPNGQMMRQLTPTATELQPSEK